MKTPLLLREALPYLQKFRGKVMVLKLGGQIVQSAEFGVLLRDIATLVHLGVRPVLVVGAGPQFDSALSAAGMPFEKRAGLRMTTEAMLPVFQEILEKDTARMADALAKEGVQVAEVSAAVSAREHPESANHGFPKGHRVGVCAGIDTATITKALENGQLPVCASIVDGWNINADDISLEMALALGAEKLLFLTGTRGIFVDDGSGEPELLTSATPAQLAHFEKTGEISGGMIPKSRAAAAAVRAGVPSVNIISGLADGTLLRELFTPHGCGTMICAQVLPEES